jgi:hypothetical protein
MSSPGYQYEHTINTDSLDSVSQLSQMVSNQAAPSSSPLCETIINSLPLPSLDNSTLEDHVTDHMLDNLALFLQAEIQVFSEHLPSGKHARFERSVNQLIQSITKMKRSSNGFKALTSKLHNSNNCQALSFMRPSSNAVRSHLNDMNNRYLRNVVSDAQGLLKNKQKFLATQSFIPLKTGIIKIKPLNIPFLLNKNGTELHTSPVTIPILPRQGNQYSRLNNTINKLYVENKPVATSDVSPKNRSDQATKLRNNDG